MTDHSGPEDKLCSSCGSLPITNSFTGELVCSACGIVLKERVETLTPEWRSPSPADDRARDGFPSISAPHGRCSYRSKIRQRAGSNNSSSQDDDSSSSIYIHKASCPILANRLRKLNAMSVSGAPASRNLKKATWEMNRVCNGLWLSCQVAERSAYFYRKALQKSLIKGRSISGFVVVAFIYLACKERMITSDDRRGKQGCRRGQAICDALLQDSCWRDAHRAPITDPFRNLTKISTRDGIEEREYLEGKGKSCRQSQP